tara:strand:- start:3323 stop:3997 length:675 start_codon:yes stop_codon:yes gene_type:complete
MDDVIKDIILFSGLEDIELERIENVMSIKTYPKNSMIVLEEEFGDTVYIVRSGTIKITRLNDEGKEVILALMGAGEFFGELAALDGEARSANALAQEECELYLLHRSDFIDLLKHNTKISFKLLSELAKRIRHSDQQIEALSLDDAEHRIGVCILNLAEDNGVIRKGQVTIKKLPYQQDIANMAGTSRETVSRVLKLLVEKGFVTKSGHTLTIPNYGYYKKVFG